MKEEKRRHLTATEVSADDACALAPLKECLTLLTSKKHFLAGCKGKVDIAVLLDGSERIDYQKAGNFKKCQQFLKSFFGSFNIAKDGTRVGLVLFSKTSEVRFDFEKYSDKKSITEAIDKIPYPRKGTNCGAGLDMVRTNLFEASARQGVRDVLLVITGGSSQVGSFLGSVVGMSRGGEGRILNKPLYGTLHLRFDITLLTEKVPLSINLQKCLVCK